MNDRANLRGFYAILVLMKINLENGKLTKSEFWQEYQKLINNLSEILEKN